MAKILYLTIDDFPSATSSRLVDFLTEKNIPATFFGIGQHLKKHSHLANEALQRGFVLGNHSYSHPHFSKISFSKAKGEILKTDCLLKKLYSEADLEWTKKLFRFPYGDKGDGNMGRVLNSGSSPKLRLRKKKIQEYLKKLGYQGFNPNGIKYNYYTGFLGQEVDLHWTLDTMDWKLKHGEHKEELWRNLKSQKAKDLRGEIEDKRTGLQNPESNEIVLLHDHPTTLSFIKELIEYSLNRGMSFGQLYRPS